MNLFTSTKFRGLTAFDSTCIYNDIPRATEVE